MNVMVGGVPFVPTLCPGYSRQLPAVQRVARLWGWFDRGGLRKGALPEVIEDYIEVFHAAVKSAQAYDMEERTRRSKSHAGH